VLLAEDNPINQQVARAILGRAGYEVRLAGNGLQALKALQESAFDVVLMDCQMPEMDGFAATAALRRLEHDHRKRRQPIVALTANAMTGDREQCIAAGFDDYLAKPFRNQELLDVIARWSRAGEQPGPKEGPAVAPPSPPRRAIAATVPALNRSMLEAALPDDPASRQGFLDHLAKLYLADAPGRLAALEAAIAAGDAPRAREASHNLKCSSAALGAEALAALSAELEALARSGKTQGALALLDAARGEYGRVAEELSRLREEASRTDRMPALS
jgi:CheY-like chemotaxis protein/HPt (histidine-containing phosphotransfer) domain-containing protein